METHLPTEDEELVPDELAVGEMVPTGGDVDAVPTEGPAVEVGFDVATDEDLEEISTEDVGFGAANDEDLEGIPTEDVGFGAATDKDLATEDVGFGQSC